MSRVDADGYDVVLAGAGPAGLALAVELARHGVRCAIVEPRVRGGVQPGAKLCNLRTVELLRRWGLDGEVRAAAELPAGFRTDVVFLPDMRGPVLARLPDVLATGGADVASLAGLAVQIPQYRLEGVLTAALAASPCCTVLRGYRVRAVEQRAGEVRVGIDDGYGTRTVRARWLVACDGADSTVRQAMGIAMRGGAPSATNLAIVLDSTDIDVLERHGPAIQYWTVGADPGGILGPIDGRRRWWMHLHGIPRGTRAADLDVQAMMTGVLGRPTRLDVVDVSPWTTRAMIADRYRSGRVLLIGDAAHVHPPMGGHGMNMAIADAVDVGWKIAAVLAGQAGDDLLDTYEIERRPLHRSTIDEALSNYARLRTALDGIGPVDRAALRRPGAAGERLRTRVGDTVLAVKRREFASAGLQLGFAYTGSPLISSGPGDPPAPCEVTRYVPDACPGRRLPHAVLGNGTALIDHLHGFTAVRTRAGRAPDAGVATLRRTADALGVDLRVVAVDDRPLRALLGADLLLVRPDTIVAWRGRGDEQALSTVLATALAAAPPRRPEADGGVPANDLPQARWRP